MRLLMTTTAVLTATAPPQGCALSLECVLYRHRSCSGARQGIFACALHIQISHACTFWPPQYFYIHTHWDSSMRAPLESLVALSGLVEGDQGDDEEQGIDGKAVQAAAENIVLECEVAAVAEMS